MRQAIKNVILWNYNRTAWQYDVLCLLILGFIFFTPQNWLSGGKQVLQPENTKNARLVVVPNFFSPQTDENTRLQKIRELSGNNRAEIVEWRERRDQAGELIAYEIDVR